MKTVTSKDSQNGHVSTGATPAAPDKVLTRVPSGASVATADPPSHPDALLRRPTVRFPSLSPSRPSARRRASLPKMVAVGRSCGRAGGGQLLPGPVGQYNTEYGEHRGRLRQR